MDLRKWGILHCKMQKLCSLKRSKTSSCRKLWSPNKSSKLARLPQHLSFPTRSSWLTWWSSPHLWLRHQHELETVDQDVAKPVSTGETFIAVLQVDSYPRHNLVYLLSLDESATLEYWKGSLQLGWCTCILFYLPPISNKSKSRQKC